MSDGSVVGKLGLDLGVNGNSIKSQIKSLAVDAQKDLKGFSINVSKNFEDVMKKSVTSSKQTISQIKSMTKGTEKSIDSVKKQVGELTSQYRKAGMTQSEAMKKAWEEVGYQSKKTTKNIKNNLKTIASESTNTMTGASNAMTSAFTGAAKKIGLALGAAFSVKALTSFTKSCIEAGSDLSEVQNVVDTAFKTMSGQVDSFAKQAIYNFGLSEKVAKQYMGTIGAMNNAFGFTEKQSYDMATAITGLTGDVASFYNLDAEESFNKLKAIWTGETESLKTLGVVMTQTALDEYALNNGFGKTTAKMTEQEKVLLRYQYVQNALSDASGDFIKTQDSWANQTRILTLRMESLKATIGQGFINLFTPIIKGMNNLLAKLSVVAEAFQKFTENIMGITPQSVGLAKVANQAMSASGGMEDLTSSASGAADEMSNISSNAKEALKTISGFDKINKLSDNNDSKSSGSAIGGGLSSGMATSTSPIDSQTTAIDKASGALQRIKTVLSDINNFIKKNFGNNLKNIWKGFINNTNDLKRNLKSVFSDIKTLGAPLASFFKGPFIKMLNTALTSAGNRLNRMFALFNTVFKDIWDVAVFPILKKLVINGLPLIAEFTTSAIDIYDTFFNSVADIFDKLWKEAAVPLLENMTSMLLDIGDSLEKFWNEYGEPITTGIKNAIKTIKEIFISTWDKSLKPKFDKIMTTIDELWTKHGKPLLDNYLQFVGTIIINGTEIINKWGKPICDFMHFIFEPTFSGSFNSILNIAKAVIGGITDYISGLLKVLTGISNFLTGVFTGDWKKAWLGLKQIVEGVFSQFEAIVKTPINAIIGMLNGFVSGFATAINHVIKALNKVNVKIPNWVPEYGGKSFGISLSEVSTKEIPMLAQGGYVKANAPQLAMIGDNRHQGEVVAPEDKLTQMAMEAVKASKGAEGSYLYEILKTLKMILEVLKALNLDIVIDGKRLKDIIVDEINKNTKNTGVCEIII